MAAESTEIIMNMAKHGTSSARHELCSARISTRVCTLATCILRMRSGRSIIIKRRPVFTPGAAPIESATRPP